MLRQQHTRTTTHDLLCSLLPGCKRLCSNSSCAMRANTVPRCTDRRLHRVTKASSTAVSIKAGCFALASSVSSQMHTVALGLVNNSRSLRTLWSVEVSSHVRLALGLSRMNHTNSTNNHVRALAGFQSVHLEGIAPVDVRLIRYKAVVEEPWRRYHNHNHNHTQ